MKKLYNGLVCFLLLAQVIPCFFYLFSNFTIMKNVNGDTTATHSESWFFNRVDFVDSSITYMTSEVYRFYSSIRGTSAGLIFESSDELNKVLFGQSYFDTLSDIDNNDWSNYGFYVSIMHFVWSLPLFIFIHIFLSFFFWIMSKFDPY